VVLGPRQADPVIRSAQWCAWARGPKGERAEGFGEHSEKALGDVANKLRPLRCGRNVDGTHHRRKTFRGHAAHNVPQFMKRAGGIDARTRPGHLVRAEPLVSPARPFEKEIGHEAINRLRPGGQPGVGSRWAFARIQPSQGIFRVCGRAHDERP
jgi:hypothetical protein